MMTSLNENFFRVSGHLCVEFTGHRWSPHKGQWLGALMFSLICVWINGWVNNREAGDLKRHRGNYDVIVMSIYGRSPSDNMYYSVRCCPIHLCLWSYSYSNKYIDRWKILCITRGRHTMLYIRNNLTDIRQNLVCPLHPYTLTKPFKILHRAQQSCLLAMGKIL